jgi:hypothetical protein
MVGDEELSISTDVDAGSVERLEYYLHIVAAAVVEDGDRSLAITTCDGDMLSLCIEGKELASLTRYERYPSYGEVSECWRLVFCGETGVRSRHRFVLRPE